MRKLILGMIAAALVLPAFGFAADDAQWGRRHRKHDGNGNNGNGGHHHDSNCENGPGGHNGHHGNNDDRERERRRRERARRERERERREREREERNQVRVCYAVDADGQQYAIKLKGYSSFYIQKLAFEKCVENSQSPKTCEPAGCRKVN